MTEARRVSVCGVVLAAGRSRRMGSDKAILAGSGAEVLWRRQWRILGEAGIERRWVSIRPDQTWLPAGVPVVRDAVPDAGPLGGILAAGAAVSDSHCAVLAVDLPDLPTAWVRTLLARARENRGVAGKWADGTYEPLAALYPRVWLEAWRAALGAEPNPPGLQTLLREKDQQGLLEVIPIEGDRVGWFRNVNTPADLGR